jgi:hypothetical protein
MGSTTAVTRGRAHPNHESTVRDVRPVLRGRRLGHTQAVTVFFARPDPASQRKLATAPVPESWNASAHPDQRRLNAYLDDAMKLLDADRRAGGEALALELTVGLPAAYPLTGYLFPLARRLHAESIAAVFGSKRADDFSTIAIGRAASLTRAAPAPRFSVRTTVSSQSSEWKWQIHRACGHAAGIPLPPGPVAVRIRLGVSPRRNWSVLWKPAIDALGPVLGTPDPRYPFHPADDRIVDLEIHRHLDDSLGNDVAVDVWWDSAPSPSDAATGSPAPRD